MIQIGTLVLVAGGLGGVLLYFAGIVTVASIVGPMVVFMIGTGLVMPNAQAGAVGPFPRIAGSASALLGFFQMGLAAVVGIAVGHGSAYSALAMMLAIALVAFGALLAYWLVVWPAPRGTEID
jgi:DHA1 family bicyclomycin/chloramphenicol resistance-like MFS transporter